MSLLTFRPLMLSLLLSLSAGAGPSLKEASEIAVGLGDKATIEAVTKELGARYPELRQQFVLMHESKSRQAASYEFPRVISHTKDARFTMAFNGEPGSQAYDELEMFEYDEATDAFRFQRIHFGAGRAYPKPVNEPLCLSCHGKDPRPNWESYNRWPGAYPDSDIRMAGTKYYFGWKSVEHDGFDSFYTKQMGHGRYEFLDKATVDGQFVIGASGGNRRAGPSHFTQLVGYLNYRRVARLLAATPDFAKYQYPIAAALYDCPNFETYLPKGYAADHSLKWYIADTKQRFYDDINRYHHDRDEGQFGKFRYVLEGRGISMHKWSMNFRGNPYSFVTPGGDPSGFLTSLLMEKGDALKPYRVWKIVGDRDYGITTEFHEEWTGDSVKQNQPACEGLLKKAKETFL